MVTIFDFCCELLFDVACAKSKGCSTGAGVRNSPPEAVTGVSAS